ncbi:MAG: penicillin-binding protein [Clostridiales bacterium]|nr:penicillin-binding protein [Clostridiales bacterium]
MEERKMSGRLIAAGVFLLAVILVFCVRLFQFQVIEGKDYLAQTASGYQTRVNVTASRGEIYDRSGQPLVTNRMGFSITFERPYIKEGTLNSTILTMTRLLTEQGEEWNQSLPVEFDAGGTAKFTQDSDSAAASLRSHLELNTYATAQNCFDAMLEKYEIEEMQGLSKEEQLTIAAVRYEMDVREFTNTNPFVFARDVSMDTVSRVTENESELPGVKIGRESIRQYNSGTLAPHIIGQVGPIYAEEYKALSEKGYKLNDQVGKDGIEKLMEDQLRGTDGTKTISRNADGTVSGEKLTKEPVAGNSVLLTIDAKIQQAAQEALRTIVTELQETQPIGKGGDCTGGSAVVVNVHTGAVLAVATYPGYDINSFNKDFLKLRDDPDKPLMNRALTGTYQPGSTMKPSVALGALQDGVIVPSSTVSCGRVYRYWENVGFTPTCLSAHGSLDVTHAIQKSCNIFFYDVGRRLTITRMNYYARQLGLGVKTGIELEESPGILAGKEYSDSIGATWTDGNTVQAAIGQLDNSFTPIQIALYAATVANGGTRYQAHLIQSVESYDFSKTVVEEQVNVLNEVTIDKQWFDVVKQGMYMVCNEPGGTIYRHFGNYPIKIGAKTGTSETGQTGRSNHSLMMSFAPYDNPEIAVSVVLEHGAVSTWDSNARVAKMIYDAYYATDEAYESREDVETLLP